jgi:hypothetical protein
VDNEYHYLRVKAYKHLNIPLPFVVEILQIRWTRLREQRKWNSQNAAEDVDKDEYCLFL